MAHTAANSTNKNPIIIEVFNADIEISSVVSESEVEKYKGNENIIITTGRCWGVGCDKFCYKSSHINNLYQIELDDGTQKVLSGDTVVIVNGRPVLVKDIKIGQKIE